MVASPPSSADAAAAVVRAVAYRRRLARADPAHLHLTDAAIEERIVGLTAHARPLRDGWWLTGRVLDGVADAEFLVWLEPASGRVRAARRRPLPEATPPRPRPDGRYYDGTRRRWVEPDFDIGRADEPVVQPHESDSPGPA